MAYPTRTVTPPATPHLLFQGVALIFALALLAGSAFATSDPLRYQGGIRISRDRALGKKEVAAVLRSLREKTGFTDLSFDSDGFLDLGNETKISGGSETARQLLSAAVNGDVAFDLEKHDRSSIVAFARLGSPISFQSARTKAQIEMLPVEIDFADFERLRGANDVIASFDLGIVLLHELAHGVLRLPDVAVESDRLGECEAHINTIRRELRLPERQTYFARLADRPSIVSGATRPHAELIFTRAQATGKGRPQLFVLTWEAGLVGQVFNDVLASRSKMGTVSLQ